MIRAALYLTLALMLLMPSAAYAENTSYYGAEYCGKLTASGTPLDCGAFVAAHPSYPLGSTVTVCYVGCADVKIIDRGPNLDLSPAAADAIGMKDAGRADTATHLH